MKIDHPTAQQIPQLLQMWKTAFGEHGGFWEMFLDTAFKADHCRCLTTDGKTTAVLYWFDCTCHAQKLAYVYAVVTHPDFRNRGLCRILLSDTHAYLTAQGYDSVLLVPEKEGLRKMYRKLGYADCTTVSEFSCEAGTNVVSLRTIGPEEYVLLRRRYLPEGGVVQEGKNMDFLAQQAQFYTGEDFLLAAYVEDRTLTGMELLGNRDAAPGIVTALGCDRGNFRTSGTGRPFAMIYPLTEYAAIPQYFGFAFD